MYNSSSSLHLAPPLTSSPNSSNFNSTLSSFDSLCQGSIASDVIYTMYTFTNIFLLLPVYILILSMGFQLWRRQRSALAGMTMSHSDFLTYNMMILEIIGVFGPASYTVGNYTNSMIMMQFGIYLFSIMFPVQTFFHVLTCVERYLAVVHPTTYMRLSKTHGVRIRNISTVCAWLLCVGWLGFWPNFPITLTGSCLGVCMVVIIFCCLSVLHVLTHPGPGEVGKNKERVDQSKQRAFHMIMVITVVLLLRFSVLISSLAIQNLAVIDRKNSCVLMDSAIWLTVPSSLVLPILFLHKAEKLSCLRKKAESGQRVR